jgi:predicted ATPase
MDRIKRVRIRNVRAIEELDLEIAQPFTVLIGENGSGKSTILECLELLCKAAEPNFMQQLYSLHRGLYGLLRKGAASLQLGVVVEDDAGGLPGIEYSFGLEAQGTRAVVQKEQLLWRLTEQDCQNNREKLKNLQASIKVNEASIKKLLKDSLRLEGLKEKIRILKARIAVLEQQLSKSTIEVIRRDGSTAEVFDKINEIMIAAPITVNSDQLLLTSFGNQLPETASERLRAVLRSIEVHLGFDTLAVWAARSYQRPVSIRAATTLFPAPRLTLLAANIANAWSELRNRANSHWEKTISLARLGLGTRLDTVVVQPDMGGGNIHLALRFIDLAEPVYAADLSDGQLSWLAFVAMVRLNEGRALLAIDEPELHLHPYLLAGVITLLKELGAPVMLATHSDHVLELLDDPAAAIRVCTLEGGKAAVACIDEVEFAKWRVEFSDIGRLRAAGYLAHILKGKSVPE